MKKNGFTLLSTASVVATLACSGTSAEEQDWLDTQEPALSDEVRTGIDWIALSPRKIYFRTGSEPTCKTKANARYRIKRGSAWGSWSTLPKLEDGHSFLNASTRQVSYSGARPDALQVDIGANDNGNLDGWCDASIFVTNTDNTGSRLFLTSTNPIKGIKAQFDPMHFRTSTGSLTSAPPASDKEVHLCCQNFDHDGEESTPTQIVCDEVPTNAWCGPLDWMIICDDKSPCRLPDVS